MAKHTLTAPVTLFFELNGQPREVTVRDRALRVVERTHPKVNPEDPGHVGAPTAGLVSSIAVQANHAVERGAKLLTLEAMKMQSNIYAPIGGRVTNCCYARPARGRQGSAGNDCSVSGPHLVKHEQFPSRFLRNQRDLIVYLPPGYHDQPQRRFPVLYLHDGQNLFDGATSFIPGMDWHVGQTADRFIYEGKVEPLIIVGIYNAGKQQIAGIYSDTHAPAWRRAGESLRAFFD